MRLLRYLKDKDYRIYCKMDRRHRRELIKLAKTVHDFDYGYLHDLVVLKIRHFLEYYKGEYNVWQDEDCSKDVILSLEHCLSVAEEIENSGLIDDPELYKKFYSLVGKYIIYWWD